MTYSFNSSGGVVRDSDGAFIPADAGNADYQAYQVWVAAGNAATPYTAPALTWSAYQGLAQTALTESDKTVLRCYENAVAVPASWSSYRKALRAIVGAASGDPTQPLPSKPAYPTGT